MDHDGSLFCQSLDHTRKECYANSMRTVCEQYAKIESACHRRLHFFDRSNSTGRAVRSGPISADEPRNWATAQLHFFHAKLTHPQSTFTSHILVFRLAHTAGAGEKRSHHISATCKREAKLPEVRGRHGRRMQKTPLLFQRRPFPWQHK